MTLIKSLMTVSVVVAALFLGGEAHSQVRGGCDILSVHNHLNAAGLSRDPDERERLVALAELATYDLFVNRCYEDAEIFWHWISRNQSANEYVLRNAQTGLMRVLAIRQREVTSVGRRP